LNHIGLAIKVCQLHSGQECRRCVSYRPKTIVNCKILISNKNRSSTKISQGWRLFCSENELKEGDIVVFQADNDFIEPNIEVFVNGYCCN